MLREITLTGNWAEDTPRVLAEMVFPNSEYERKSYFVRHFIGSCIHQQTEPYTVTMSSTLLQDLLDAPGREEMKQRYTQGAKRGVVAGDILASLFLMDTTKCSEPSVNKALFVASQFAKEEKYGNGDPMAASESQLKGIWREFKPVSHLWAAFRLNLAYPFADKDTILSAGLPALLAVADELKAWALGFVSEKRIKANVFSGQDFLHIHHALPLTGSLLQISQPPDRLLKTLKRYKA